MVCLLWLLVALSFKIVTSLFIFIYMLIFGVTFDHSFHSNISSNMQKKNTIMYPLVIQTDKTRLLMYLIIIKSETY